MLQGGGTVALEALVDLVGGELAIDSEGGNVLALVREQKLVSRGEGVVVGIKDDGQAKDGAVLQSIRSVSMFGWGRGGRSRQRAAHDFCKVSS